MRRRSAPSSTAPQSLTSPRGHRRLAAAGVKARWFGGPAVPTRSTMVAKRVECASVAGRERFGGEHERGGEGARDLLVAGRTA